MSPISVYTKQTVLEREKAIQGTRKRYPYYICIDASTKYASGIVGVSLAGRNLGDCVPETPSSYSKKGPLGNAIEKREAQNTHVYESVERERTYPDAYYSTVAPALAPFGGRGGLPGTFNALFADCPLALRLDY